MGLLFVLWGQTEEEPEVFDHRSSYVVHSHCPGDIQALYQVLHTNQQNSNASEGEIHKTWCSR